MEILEVLGVFGGFVLEIVLLVSTVLLGGYIVGKMREKEVDWEWIILLCMFWACLLTVFIKVTNYYLDILEVYK